MNKLHLKDEAIRLRVENRLSLEAITKILPVSQGTLSAWLKPYPLSEWEILERKKNGNKNRVYPKKKEIIKKPDQRFKPFEDIRSLRARRNFLARETNGKCELCGWGEVNPFSGKVPLEVHHKDGDKNNNSRDNLQILCPNCHALTDNFSFNGRRHSEENRRKVILNLKPMRER